MPYKNVNELDDKVKEVLPKKAQEIYMGAFNGAYQNLRCEWSVKDEDKKKCEGSCHAIAWSAVKKKYEKDEKSGKWKPIKD